MTENPNNGNGSKDRQSLCNSPFEGAPGAEPFEAGSATLPRTPWGTRLLLCTLPRGAPHHRQPSGQPLSLKHQREKESKKKGKAGAGRRLGAVTSHFSFDPLARTCSHGQTTLQGMLGNVVFFFLADILLWKKGRIHIGRYKN